MCGLSYNPENPPVMPDRKPPANRILRSTEPNKQGRQAKAVKPCNCELQLSELRQEVVELTRTVNELKDIISAKFLFPHLSLAEAQSDATEVSYEHVRPPKRPRTDSALYLPDIPDGFSDSTAESMKFKRRTRKKERMEENGCTTCEHLTLETVSGMKLTRL